MKAKIGRGTGFRGALNYVFEEETKNAERVGGNMAGNTPRDLAHEFATVRQLRPDIEKPVWHCSLALPSGDRLSAEKWEAVSSDFMQRMGFDPINTPWVAVRHQDTEHDHIHILASRVGLDGKVWLGQWEARRAINATQELERAHGLTLTPGLGTARAERRKLSANEINMAVRTGDEPPRQRLQRLLDEAIKDKPSAPDLADRLQAAGVVVRANVASTGRMNGFAFEVDGVPFKASDLGKNYAWAGLQNAGVSYDQTTDRARLERYRPTATDREQREHATASREPDARGLDQLAAGSGERNGADLAAIKQAEAGRGEGIERLRPDNRHPAPDPRRTHTTDERERSAGIRAESKETGRDHTGTLEELAGDENQPQQHGESSPADRDTTRPSRQLPAEHEPSRREADHDSERNATEILATGPGTDLGRSSGRDGGSGWADRFKQASAAQRRADKRELGRESVERGDGTRARIDEQDRQSAREIDPSAYLEGHGYTVKREGRHLSVTDNGDEVYRLTRKDDGHWLWCDRYGNNGGDTIDLVREIEPGTGYAEAVYRLSGAPTVRPQPRAGDIGNNKNNNLTTIITTRQLPKLPYQGLSDSDAGREYLMLRGISRETIEHAEQSGMLRYADGGVLFVGYDRAGTAQNVTRRATATGDPVQKRDLRGSDKSYPPILPGDPKTVWIVEGGTDALAMHDLAKRIGKPPPTVIVSGGANVRSFLEQADVQAVLKRAGRVTVVGENEKNPAGQAKADAGHEKQAKRVAEISRCEVRRWTPKPEHGKDVADMNARQVAVLARRQDAMREQARPVERDSSPEIQR